jgi:hypothetical protein
MMPFAIPTLQGDLKGKDDLAGSTYDLFVPCPRGEHSRIGYTPTEKASRFFGYDVHGSIIY